MPANPRKNRTRWIRRWVVALLVVVGTWMSLDFGYSLYVESRIKRWEANVVRDQDGIRIGCQAFSVGEDSDTALLLIHGINESPHAFSKVAPELARQGFYCRCMRVKGFGETVAGYQESGIPDWLASVDREVRKLRKSHRRVVIVSHSLGGAISINYTLEHPGMIDGLVLAAPAIDVSSSRSPVFSVRFWHGLAKRTLFFTKIMQSPFGLDVLDPNEKESELRTPFTPRQTINQVFEIIKQNRGRAAEISIPVLVCLGKHDKVIDNAAAVSFFQALPARRKHLEILENSAHAILVDYQWQDFSQQVARFMKELQ